MKKILMIVLLIFIPNFSYAEITFDVNGKWETTFDCFGTDWAYGDGGACDDITLSGGSKNTTESTQIKADANHSGGTGGKGARFFVVTGDDLQSQPFFLHFPTAQKEFWLRFYTRWENGYTWAVADSYLPEYEKSWYVRTAPIGSGYGSDPSAIIGYAGDISRITNQGGVQGFPASDYYPVSSAGDGWEKLYPTKVSDGGWHCVEFYCKMSSSATTADGIGRVWINGDLVAQNITVDWVDGDTEAFTGWLVAQFRGNQNEPNTIGDMYIDYDDIVVYNKTPPNTDTEGNAYIGPIGTTPTSSGTTKNGFGSGKWGR